MEQGHPEMGNEHREETCRAAFRSPNALLDGTARKL
jgi:hypothetical protein